MTDDKKRSVLGDDGGVRLLRALIGRYKAYRMESGARPATINREMATLAGFERWLDELRRIS